MPAAAGRRRAGGRTREFDNEGPNVHESLRMLGGKPATELREFPEVVAKRKGARSRTSTTTTRPAAHLRSGRGRRRQSDARPRRRRRKTRRRPRCPDKSAVVFAGGSGAHRADGADDAGAHSTKEGDADDAHRVQVRRLLARALARLVLATTVSIGNEASAMSPSSRTTAAGIIRMGMETAALFAWSTGRILVLPPKRLT